MAKQKKTGKKADRRVKMFEGLPVVDASADVCVSVTPADIRNASTKQPGKCAAAVAGSRELKREVKVFLSRMYVKDEAKKRWVRFITPGNAAREIISFDRGSAFEPGDYTFKAPSPCQRLGTPRSRTARDGGPHKGKQHVTANIRVSAAQTYQREKTR